MNLPECLQGALVILLELIDWDFRAGNSVVTDNEARRAEALHFRTHLVALDQPRFGCSSLRSSEGFENAQGRDLDNCLEMDYTDCLGIHRVDSRDRTAGYAASDPDIAEID